MLDAISILSALVTGFLLVQAFDPVRMMEPRWAALLFRGALGAATGMGLASIVFFLLDVLGAATPAIIFSVDIAMLALFGWLSFRARRVPPPPLVPTAAAAGFRWSWLLALAFGALLAISCVRLVQMAIALPVGDWDAWAIWNLRAKFLAGPAGAWRFALSPLASAHPDYPLLLSGFVARTWRAGGNMDPIVPPVTSLLFFGILLAFLVSAVALVRGTASGLLAGLVTLCTTSLLVWAPAQYADIPLAVYYLGAIALLFVDAVRAPPSGHWPLFWAGLCTSFAAWTKNEGIVFLAIVGIVFCALSLWRRAGQTFSGAPWLLAGMVPGVLLMVWFKFFLAPAADPLARQGASGLLGVLVLNRYAEIASGFFTNLLNLGSGVTHPLILLAVLAILMGRQVEERFRLTSIIAATALALVFLSYCAVLLVTPYGVAWQAQRSFDRLLLQVWPSVLLVSFVQLRRVQDAAAPPVKTSPTRKSKVLTGRSAAAKMK